MAHKFAVLLDEKRMGAIKGSGLEEKVSSLFGGALQTFILEVPEDKSKQIMDAFDTARIDSRGFITDLPIAFNRTIFEEIAKSKSLGVEALDGVLKRVSEIKKAAAKESESLPPPDIDISDIEKLQKTPRQTG
ncbi:MAG: hypothetical protein AMJ45_00030 [Syntrophobacter sp. DG_60]|nr:MAG: hypothetical protein AMJ45_00030 [Syntrophobacter sp. DG_60]